MNWQHFQAFLWLRWRLRINQLKRGGLANFVILVILAMAGVASAAILFVGFLALGLFALKTVPTPVLMYVMDGAVVAFLFLWAVGLLTELQRSEALSLEKFLHLPVSLRSAFAINYFSSLPSLSLVWFLSAVLGLSFGLIFSRGWAMFWLLPMLAAFLLMVTALTYQFQGWLATLMTNPRRRRTVIVMTSMVFILLCQLPNLINILRPWQAQSKNVPAERPMQEQKEFREKFKSRKGPFEQIQKETAEHLRRLEEESRRNDALKKQEEDESEKQIEQTVRWMNLLLPPGWLPAGVEAAAKGNMWPIALAIVGPVLIGMVSLGRAYRTTMRLYTGQYTSGRTTGESRSVDAPTSRRAPAVRSAITLLERKLPLLSEQAAAITLAAFRSLLRAPESKMLLLTPVLLLIVFGSFFLAGRGSEIPEGVRPLIAFGAMIVVLLSMSQLLGNQFGFDRDGFRVFVLSPARRSDILLGKNLALSPVALTIGAIAAVCIQILYPMRIDQFLALAPGFVSMYLLYCLPGNMLSILVPMRIAAGAFQPTKPGGFAILLQMFFTFFYPIILAVVLLPLGIEWGIEYMGWRHGIPFNLVLSVLECAGIICMYGLVLQWQGELLQTREQRILQVVTTRTE